MNSTLILLVVAAFFLIYGLGARRLEALSVTGPMLFAAFGLAISPMGFGLVTAELGHGALHTLAEITLILVLFGDAALIDLGQLRRDHRIPVRLLTIGLPLCVVFGTVLALLIFPGFNVFEAALLAAILAPTDAALGQAVVSDQRVPVRIRQALSVESGLNDGVALPLVLMLVALASMMGEGADAAHWLRFGLLQVTLGPLAGLAVGFVAALMVRAASARGWLAPSAEGMIALAVAFLCFAAAEAIQGNGFIGAFVGGLAFGNCLGYECKFLYEFAEAEGKILTLGTFLMFGLLLLPEALAHITPAVVVYALLSLTVVRILPAALSLTGLALRPSSILFLGWFGPRGLASVLFVLLILEEGAMGNRQVILVVTAITVAISILAHGVSAGPAVTRYGRVCDRLDGAPEHERVPERPFSQ